MVVPMYHGISKERDKITAPTTIASVQSLETDITLEEIYAQNEAQQLSPEALNNIATAAGDQTQADAFSTGFRPLGDNTL